MTIINQEKILQEIEATIFLSAADRWRLPPDTCGPVACAATSASKEHVLRRLLAALSGKISLDPRLWQEVRLVHGSLGEPLVVWDGAPVLSVSFSQAGGRTWGALTGAGRVGIDVALASEFPPNYPLNRVFSREEFDRTHALVGGAPARTAALLWSLKEAAVKALGVGFNFLAPREIAISPGIPHQRGYLFEVDAGRLVKTWARPEGTDWLALALLE